MFNLRLAACTAVFALASVNLHAATISQWDLTGTPGNQVTTSGTAIANVTASNLARGPGLTASAAGNSLSATGWQTAPATLPAADQDYFSLGFTVAPGFTVDLDALYFGSRSSNTGPGTIGLFYSGDGFGTALSTFTMVGNTFRNDIVDLSALSPISGNVEFRLLEIGNTRALSPGDTASAGTYRATAYFTGGVFDRNLQFTGTLAPVRVDAPLLALPMLLGLLMAARRRRVA